MKICILHLSDFHVHEGEHFLPEKIIRFLDSLNVLGRVDEYFLVFSGDLANKGKINDYKQSRYIIGQIIRGVKQKQDNEFVKLLMVPGNHDLSLSEGSRTRQEIQDAYDNNSIESLLSDEIKLLDNYHKYSHAKARVPHDAIFDKQLFTCGNKYTIQFNLINTAFFSTLKPDDKELHYFPKDKINLLKKPRNADLCVTVMHHSCEWFNWKYKNDLEKAIINNSELLLIGHDHFGNTKEISIDNSLDTWVSCAGDMKFSDIDYHDSFNAILINVDSNTFNGYIFSWDSKERMYTQKVLVADKPLQNRTNQIMPLRSFLKEIKDDSYNHSDDFTKYFVFPKLICAQKNEFGKHDKVVTIEEFLEFIEAKKRVLICGYSGFGKSILLKHLYCSIISSKTPLFMSIGSTPRIKTTRLIKQLFEEQYGDDPMLYERYQQLEKRKKILIVDDWNRLKNSKNQDHFMSFIDENFYYVVISGNSEQQGIIESVKDEINEEYSFHELKIRPFFAEKRSQLVRNICALKGSYKDEDIERVNRLIDSLVLNNSRLFSLDPGFIIMYTDYFIKDRSYNYTKGEAVFSKVFEHGIHNSIISSTKISDVDEVITAFEEIAGHIYTSRNDILKPEVFCQIIDRYNDDYNVRITARDIQTVGLRTKILRQTDDLSVYFSNKNYLAYFIAKYLLRLYQSDGDYSGIDYALQNICFGINSDIILFISYLASNTKIVMSISSQAEMLLSPWEELDFEKNNLNFIRNTHREQVTAPTKEEHKKLIVDRERIEERQYSDGIVEAKGLFEYNENDIDKPQFRLIRAFKYTEMICKALPAFNNILRRQQKTSLVESIYSYPHKIVFALLEPLRSNIDKLCDEFLKFANETIKPKGRRKIYTKDDILDIIDSHTVAIILGTYDHFSELCTSSKTIGLLYEKETTEISKQLEKLMIIEQSGNTDAFVHR